MEKFSSYIHVHVHNDKYRFPALVDSDSDVLDL